MIEDDAKSARFVSLVGWGFLLTGAIGLLVSAAQLMLLTMPAPPGLPLDRRALAAALGVVLASALVIMVSVAFLRRRRWAHSALTAITALGVVASLCELFIHAPALDAPPAGTSAEYTRLLRLISFVDVVAPLAACLVLSWILWRLRSAAVRDQFH